jgi:O-antigen ligase
VILLGVIPFILNGLVTTISRSGFLALAVGGLVYLFLAPKQYRGRIRMLSLLALILFGMLAGPSYWNRMQSLQHAGDQVQGVDTGNDRIELIKAQWRMFKGHPFGCGSTCTIVLSPKYLDEKFLGAAQSGADPTRMVRASHNTFMTMLVEHGIPGALFYLSMLLWIFKNVMSMSRVYSKQTGFLPMAFPAIGAAFAAITVGDMFVTYAKLEVRIWFLAILMAMIAIEAARVRQAKLQQQPASPAPSGALPPGLPAARGGFRPAAGG